MTRLLVDIEANGLLPDVTEIWCAVTYNLDTGIFTEYRPDDIDDLIDDLEAADEVIGHNIIGYDIPALTKVCGLCYNNKIVDTLVLGKLTHFDKDRSFRHSLAAYGERLGEEKIEFNDWTKFSEEQLDYCRQDVITNLVVYKDLISLSSWLPHDALLIEQVVREITTKQTQNGWLFDVKKAKKLEKKLRVEYDKALSELLEAFPARYLSSGPMRIPKKPYKRLGVEYVGNWQPIKLTEFNPGSGVHLCWWVALQFGGVCGWPLTQPIKGKGGGTPKTDSDTIEELFSGKSWAKPLLHYIEVAKLLSQLADGDKAWLKNVGPDGRIHGEADTLGAVTGRFTHSNPNLSQVPSTKAYMGKECRELFIAKPGYVLVGCDAQGLELRTLSHYLAKYDGGQYADIVLDGDIHIANMKAAGLNDRDVAKTFCYAFIYGAGNAKIGLIIGGTAQQGGKLKERFLQNTPGLLELRDTVIKAAKRGWLKTLSGRRLYVRSPHSALNTLLQGAGAMYMKYVVAELVRQADRCGYDYKIVGQIHDEIQSEVREDQAEAFAKMAEKVFIKVGKELNMRIKMEGESKIGLSWDMTH